MNKEEKKAIPTETYKKVDDELIINNIINIFTYYFKL